MKRKRYILLALLALTPLACSRIPSVDSLLSDNDAARTKALTRLAKCSDDQKTPLIQPLAESLENVDSRLAQRASLALIAIGDKSVPALTNLLKTGSFPGKIASLEVLGNLGPNAKSAEPEIINLLQEPHPLIQEEAKLALSKIDPEYIKQTVK